MSLAHHIELLQFALQGCHFQFRVLALSRGYSPNIHHHHHHHSPMPLIWLMLQMVLSLCLQDCPVQGLTPAPWLPIPAQELSWN